MLNQTYRNVFFYLLALLCLGSCREKNVAPDKNQVETVNTWIYEMMEDAYYWYKQLPAESTLDAKADPTDYFEKLVYQRQTVDRFSMVTDDIDALQNQFNGISKIFGISYSISYLDDKQVNVGLFLSYVVKSSPADLAGLKRGDVVLKVKDTQLTKDNYAALLSESETATLTLGSLLDGVFVPSDKSITITKAEVTEDPVAFSTVIDKSANGKKIGYLVYTQFVQGTSADKNKYDNELRQIFADFKSKGVNELVLDLRFNSGGYISSATTLASLIGKNINNTKIFYKEEWNDKYIAYWQKQNGPDALNYNFINEPNNIGNNTNRVFVLTSESTASASELVINGLKPYMEVVTIGSHTAGKNLFGSLIADEEERWKWGVYLMLGRTANANGESDYGTVNGMEPTHQVDDLTVPYLPFAHDNETLFRKALEVMGVTPSTTRQIHATKSVNPVRTEMFRDDLRIRDNRMIKNDFQKIREQ